MRCTGYEMARYKGTQASHLYEKSMHTLCTIQWATAPGRSLNYPRPKSITHLRTFSDNGVYVSLQLFLVILVSDQRRRVLIPYSYRQAPWGLLHARGWLSRYTWDQQLYVVSEPRETHSPMLKARFLHLTNLVAQPEIEPPTSWLPGQRLTTRPRLSIVIHGWPQRCQERLYPYSGWVYTGDRFQVWISGSPGETMGPPYGWQLTHICKQAKDPPGSYQVWARVRTCHGI